MQSNLKLQWLGRVPIPNHALAQEGVVGNAIDTIAQM